MSEPDAERGRRGASRWGYIDESSEGLPGEVHRSHVSSSQHRVEVVERDSHHEVIADDAAAHSALTEKGETAEHLAFADVPPATQRLAKAIRESLVVRHENRDVSYCGPPSAFRDGECGVP